MLLTAIGFSSFEAVDLPSHLPKASRSIESCRSTAASLRAIVHRVLGVTAVLGISLLLHALVLVAAERAYAPYTISRTGEYVEASAAAGTEHRHLASAISSRHR